MDSEPRMGADFCFNIYDGKRALMVAAASQSEKSQWMEDILETVQVRGLDINPWTHIQHLKLLIFSIPSNNTTYVQCVPEKYIRLY